jgi:anti-sigma factor RsiW
VSCRDFSDHQLWAYLDRGLSDDERRQVERHVAGCADCLTDLEQMRRRPLVLGEQRLISPPPDFHRRVMARIAVEAQPAWRSAERSWLALLVTARRLTAVSAAALLLAMSSAIVVAAALAAPLIERAVPEPGPGWEKANSMALMMHKAIQPIGPFFRDWGWFVLLVGMAATVMVIGARALAVQLSNRS